ncbi:MAG: nickel/cobalt transporter [Pseudomonadota bacterium]
MVQELVVRVFEAQRDLHEQLIAGLQQATADTGAAFWVIALSFLYGLFHAAGPGHGKVIITTYLATHPTLLRRGVMLASLGALCQGLTAIVLVYGLVLIIGTLVGHTDVAVDWSERLSFVLMLVLGLWLLLRGTKSLRNSLVKKPEQTAHEHVGHEHPDHEQHDGCCDHHHVADEAQLNRASQGLVSAALVILSMGLRPCTGAILVLVFASVIEQAMLGLLAVIAMSTGTAMAISLLAIITVFARDRIGALATRYGRAQYVRYASATVLLGGGLILAWFGGSLLYWSFNAPAHPLQL